MYKVKNKHTIYRLALRSLKESRLRNIVAVIAIMLTCIMFTSLATLGLGSMDAFEQAAMRKAGGSGHASVKYVDDSVFDAIKDDKSIEQIGYRRLLSDYVKNPDLSKRPGEFWYYDESAIDMGFATPKEGHIPEKENEIMVDTMALEMMGIKPKVGTKITLDLTINKKGEKRDFILSGYWESDPAFNASLILASKSYMEKHASELSHTNINEGIYTGTITCEITFKKAYDIVDQTTELLFKYGYQDVDDTAPHYILTNVNWGSISNSLSDDPLTFGIIVVAAVVILLSGYLIIYNIFQISIIKDIHFYGLLKTIGATKRQIGKIIHIQALLLSIIGIPLGLIIGFMIGAKLVPMVMEATAYSGTEITVEINPWIFVSAFIFTIITVFISTIRPGRTAGKMSSIEAVKYTDIKVKKKEKKTTNGGKIWKMALSNLGRNKGKTILILLSLSLGLLILNSCFTISHSLDGDKFVSQFVASDFSTEYTVPPDNSYMGIDDTVPEDAVSAFQSLDSFKDGGRLFYSAYEDSLIKNKPADRYNNFEEDKKMDPNALDDRTADLYGAEDFILENSEVIEDIFDIEKFKTGKYVLLGVEVDDYGKPYYEESSEKQNIKIGEEVTLKTLCGISDEDEQKVKTGKYTVMAKIKQNPINHIHAYSTTYNFYLPAETYLDIVEGHPLFSYSFNVKKDSLGDVERYMKNYTEKVNKDLTYTSKATAIEDFEGLNSIIMIFGGLLSLIIALIGILNFTNSIITGIISRRREFAMLEAVGMTRRQLVGMIMLEGLLYGIGTIVILLIISIAASEFALNHLLSNLWFASYKLTVMPLLICYPILIALTIIIPRISNKVLMKDSVVDRIRESE